MIAPNIRTLSPLLFGFVVSIVLSLTSLKDLNVDAYVYDPIRNIISEKSQHIKTLLQKNSDLILISKNLSQSAADLFSIKKAYAQQSSGLELLSSPWTFSSAAGGAAEKYQAISAQSLQGMTHLTLTYNLNGSCILPGDASAIIFDQGGEWRYVSLANYGQNCLNGSQTVTIPLSSFPGLNTSAPVGTFHARFWRAGGYNISISSAKLSGGTVIQTPIPTFTTLPTVVPTPKPSVSPTPAPTPTPQPSSQTELLSNQWVFSASTGAVERYQTIQPSALTGMKSLTLTYNLNGACLTGNDASAIIFDQGGEWRYVSLANYGQNCHSGSQTVQIPLAQFPGLDTTKPVGTFHARFWGNKAYNITISSAKLTGLATTLPSIPPIPAPTPVPLPSITPRPVVNPTPIPSSSSWEIRSADSMKETKDRICAPRDANFIRQWVESAKNLGVTHIAISTPYDNPACGSAVEYTRAWSDAIHNAGLKVWHRHMPLAFEGIYSAPKDASKDYISQIHAYILAHPEIFREGDIFTPIPEPQNGGISGVTYCANSVCIFSSPSHFNQWLRNAMSSANDAFSKIGLANKLKIGYYGFDGFVAWGDNNPDWNGILEDATVQMMGNITIDHYPELIGSSMATDLDELHARYPNVPIIIGEWGTVTGGDTEATVNTSMKAAQRSYVKGFNYWHMGSGGAEALINEDFSKNKQYDDVQRMFTSL